MPEQQLFPPPKEFSQRASIHSMADYEALYQAAVRDPEKFWAEQAGRIHWFAPWTKVLDWSNVPFATWFVGGKTNVTYNCIDRHLNSSRKDKIAVIWEGEDFTQITLTYQELHRRVCKFSNALKSLGIRPGNHCVIYMPMVLEPPLPCWDSGQSGIRLSLASGD